MKCFTNIYYHQFNSYKTQVKQTHLTIHDQFQFPQKHPPSDGRLLELDFESNVLPGLRG